MKRLFRIFDFKPDHRQDVQDEIESHLEFEAERLQTEGLTPEEARQEAERRFGDRSEIASEAAKHVSRWAVKVRWRERMDIFRQDLCYSARMLYRTRGTTFVLLILLGLGIGATTALFSTLKGVYLDPLPLPHSHQLVFLWEQLSETPESPVSFANFSDWREQARTFQGMGAYLARYVNLTDQGDPVRVRGALVTASLFPALGVNPERGRFLLPDEDYSGARVVVLSHGIWVRRYGTDPEILGRQVDVNGSPHVVVGVMPEGFQHPDAWSTEPIEVWTPIPPGTEFEPRRSRSFRVIGRLSDGVSQAEVRQDLDRVGVQLAEAYPETNGEGRIGMEDAHAVLFGEAGGQILLILGASILVLLIACGNVAAIQFSRAPERQADVAIRSALGATRGRIMGLLLTESALLSLSGGVLGILLASWMLEGLKGFISGTIPRVDELHLELPALLFALGLAAFAGISTGLLPAMAATRARLSETLKEGRRGYGSGRKRTAVQNIYVVGQVALSLILANSALLLFQSLNSARSGELGFEAGNVLTMGLSLRGTGYSIVRGRAEFYDELFPSIRGLPGTVSVGAASSLPFMPGTEMGVVTEEGWTENSSAEPRHFSVERIAGEYFSTLGIPLRAGRTFIRGDDDGTLEDKRAILNEEAVQELWPGENPIGRRFALASSAGGLDEPSWITVIGVVGNIRNRGLEVPPAPEVYLTYASFPPGRMFLTVRTDGDPLQLVRAVRAEIQRLDPLQAVSDVRTVEDLVQAQTSRRIVYTTLIGAFAGLAVLLVAVGVYGAVSRQVTQRTHEMGIRIALGARQIAVQRLVVGQAFGLVVPGFLLGGLGILASKTFIQSLLYQVEPLEPIVLLAGFSVLLAVSLAAASIPVRRVAGVDPAQVLRGD